MATRDLAAFMEDGCLEYPGIRSTSHPDGKLYKVASPTAKVGLYLSNLADTGAISAMGATISDADMAKLRLDDDAERSLYKLVLGATFEEMLEDGVEWAMLQMVSRDAFLCFGVNRDFADAVLEGQGKALVAANRATRRAAARKPRSTANTQRRKGGSSSAKASTVTPDPTPARTSTPSSPPIPTGEEGQEAAAV